MIRRLRPSDSLGRLTVVEGGTLFFGGNRLSRPPDDGTIDFANPNRIEPDLGVRAATRASRRRRSELEITGTPSTLQTTPSSDNPQWTQSDLVSLLLIGKTAQDADANAAAADQLLGVLTAGLLGTAGRAVGLDTVRLEHGSPDVRRGDAGLVASDTNPGQRLTASVSRSASSARFLVFSQSLHGKAAG